MDFIPNEQPRSKLRGINPNLVDSFAASGGEFNPKRLKAALIVGAALAAKPEYIVAKAAPTSGKIIVVFNANRN